ncbi:MSL3 [Lepeophtheirus salmonis]|uniref:MSL3 n=1 Tax=Lepeophtheirus salmonis TaxID=72036 RepID=A0A7R8CBF1_LEPSM|nr:MSL3 [Lepeophtheirus salmonis]CAF2757617.1 MSL3 [Lepeophtheirus salmonis]
METKSSGSANIGIFQPNEWVLCYEPDPCKVKVIYNAKILEIEDGEYLVHFRGWNSSWDRRVTQEFLLKDNPANRILQRSLAQNVSKKGSPENREKKSFKETCPPKCSSFQRISEPFCPVVRVLEQYVRNFAERKVIHAERSLGRHNLLPVTQRESLVATELESIQSAIDLCKEMAEGLRIILDYNLNNILLYEKESEVCVSVCSPRLPSLKLPVPNSSRRPSTDRSSSSGRSTPTNSVGSLPSCSSSNKKYIFKCVTDSLEGWKLLPDTLYDESPPLPPLLCTVLFISFASL